MDDAIESPPSVTFYPSRVKIIGMACVCAAFVGIGVWMTSKTWFGYVTVAFFGLGLVVSVVQLIPGSTYFYVDRNGFTFCNLFRKTTVPWLVVEEFSVVSITQRGMKIREMVGFDFVPSYDRATFARRVSKFVGECESALPDLYGMKAEELAEFMNSCLARVKTAVGKQEAES